MLLIVSQSDRLSEKRCQSDTSNLYRNNDIYQRVKEFTELIFSVHIILAYSKNIKPSSSSRE